MWADDLHKISEAGDKKLVKKNTRQKFLLILEARGPAVCCEDASGHAAAPSQHHCQ